MTAHLYTAGGLYDDLVSFASVLFDAGINAVITSALVIYAQPSQCELVESLARVSGLTVQPVVVGEDTTKPCNKVSVATKSPIARRMRRSW